MWSPAKQTNRAFFKSLACICALLRIGIANATLTTETIFSPSNGENLSFRVYTPPGYTTDLTRSYPVVISLHGIGGTGQQRSSIYASVLDARINAGDILPAVWIFPDGQTNSFYGDAFDGHKQVYSHIIGEALPFVDGKYRTIEDREFRAMEGFSMGGFGAGLYAAKHPELFSAIVEYAGALSTWQNLAQFNNAVADEMYDLQESNFLPYSLWSVTDASAATIASQVNYKMIVGDADSQYQSNVRFRDHLLTLGINPHFEVLSGITHLADSYLNDGTGLEYLSDHFAANFRRNGDYNHDGTVSVADFTAMRSAFASTQFAADGNENGTVDAADYIIWRNQFVGSGGNEFNSVPEPNPYAVAGTFLFCSGILVNRRRPAHSCANR